MPLITYNNKSLYFIHIPKTGGSTITNSLLHTDGFSLPNLKNKVETEKCKVMSGHLHLAGLDIHFPEYNKYPQFTILRNPWHKICSEYVWKKKDPHFNKFNKWVRNRLGKYKRNNYIDDNHFRPQIEFVSPQIKIFLTEYSQKAQDWVCDYFEKEINFEHSNKSINYEYPSVDEILDNRSRTLYYDLYQQDIDLYLEEKRKYEEGK